MKKVHAKRLLQTFILLSAILMFSPTMAQTPRFFVPIGITYYSGVGKVEDVYKGNRQTQGIDNSSHFSALLPYSANIQPFVEFDYGLGVGFGAGTPIVVARSLGSGASTWRAIPYQANVRYSFLSGEDNSPYVQFSVKNYATSGAYSEGSIPGVALTAGVSFFRNRSVGMGVEVGYDAAQIKVRHYNTPDNYDVRTIRPGGFLAGLYVNF